MMINTESKPMFKEQVYTTTDYFMFKSIDGNRNKNLLHINRLKKSMSENYLFTIIVVNEKYEIIDGQHRFEVIKELQLPLYYIICNGYGLKEVHVLNANTKNWKSDDYLEGYCNLGYIDYIKYRDFQNEFGFGHHQSLLFFSNYSGSAVKEFFEGKLKTVDKYDEAVKKASLLKLLEPYYNGYRRRSFVVAFLRLLKNENFEFTDLLQKLRAQPSALVDCVTSEQYISLIEEIYNYKRKVKINLRY